MRLLMVIYPRHTPVKNAAQEAETDGFNGSFCTMTFISDLKCGLIIFENWTKQVDNKFGYIHTALLMIDMGISQHQGCSKIPVK